MISSDPFDWCCLPRKMDMIFPLVKYISVTCLSSHVSQILSSGFCDNQLCAFRKRGKDNSRESSFPLNLVKFGSGS